MTFYIDSIHPQLPLKGIGEEIWQQKYKFKTDHSWLDTVTRVVNAVYLHDDDPIAKADAITAMRLGLWMPAGRIIAGAGTGNRVTLNNCFVTGTIHDSMEGIMLEHTNFALTMQQGGGDGADFSTIRPAGSILKRTGTKASGPLPFMDMWNAMCQTVMSAGNRRGAMMATMCDTHPDLPAFITAKQTPGRLTQFNVSVLVSDAFMSAIQENADWLLYFHEAPIEHPEQFAQHDFVDDNGVQQYVYAVWNARELWDLIISNTYKYAEPGVIFIDRVNEFNNLKYVETIRCTNPCGEQPLPPHGCCNLGHINLARLVHKPFTTQAYFDWEQLLKLVYLGVRFLDNVIDVTGFPLEAQAKEQYAKRRIGLGHTGFADALAQLGIRYGSFASIELAESIQKFICINAYQASSNLAVSRGSFPAFVCNKYFSGTFAGIQLPEEVKNDIRRQGMRNGVLLTIAPTGTTSLMYGNVSTGPEPTFAHKIKRRIRQEDNTYEERVEFSYIMRLWKENIQHDIDWDNPPEYAKLPAYAVTVNDLSVQDHVLIFARLQRWVDASISKTINCPENIDFESFKQVYTLAYNMGAKGCTTYRPSDIRGAILVDASKPSTIAEDNSDKTSENLLRKRPKALDGRTYQIQWPNREASLYLTINMDDTGIPFEILINSKDGTNSEWTTALSLMITAILRKGGDTAFIASELMQIKSIDDGAWIDGHYVASLPAYIGSILAPHLSSAQEKVVVVAGDNDSVKSSILPKCPKCGQPTLEKSGSCETCYSCGYSKCH